MVNCGSLYVLKQPFGVARPIREDINIVILYQNGNNSIKNQDDIVIVQEVVSWFPTRDIAQAYSLQTDGGVYLTCLD